jgi:hypothetical protein
VSSGMGSEVETAGVGVLAPIGTMPISSGRKEGEGVARAGPEVSDVVVPRVAASTVVWAEAGELSIRAIKKKLPQRGRSKWNSRITKQI